MVNNITCLNKSKNETNKQQQNNIDVANGEYKSKSKTNKQENKQYWGGTWGSAQRTQQASSTLGGEGDDSNQKYEHNHL